MATHVALDVTTWLGGYDLTGDSNQTQTTFEVDALEDTRFRMRGRSRVAGLETATTSVSGFAVYGDGEVDDVAFDGLATAQPLSQSVDGEEESVAYFWQARTFNYQTFGNVGELVPFSLSAQSGRGAGSVRTGGRVRGRVLKTNDAVVSATGATGTAFELGEVDAGRYLYAAFHVFSAGASITAVLESDEDDTFGSATTRMTFGPITAVGGVWGTRVAGPITDTWYRLRVTAISGDFELACVAGIK
ncbi:hypothetical protein [Lentzea sp. NBRC 102530]|uniref:hypothetical protein n=1 Tax=Lentzea sp. NBRC 102530 TaxID=3032201 RepID=UPI0024A5A8A6|nr:hypothetical protein [Lentzea sp. NBRC 102530]GLY55220.1 hypothetical protein Lesp01_88750 [Lentzea sp. NBRC 102530]